ncbi:LysR family transcriptional regulator [Thauera sinica]|uniref:LysR family transcriptional regulator n=1 Tax=Thauera sinica TaxID=2665146 RepID=A0ABW1AKY0_9RHOO|nr:LysR family transcriptional regulator [Thauera sp. K11]ATE62819.1 LysR family transcriptional regulator [Thauera sp. K11]
MDRLQAMQLFTRIVELGSFSRAAEQLSLPRASATQIIKQLEAHLGVRLLQRTTRHVSPTLDGSAYYQRCVAILADIDETEASFSQAARHPQGRLKIDLPASLGRIVVIPALPAFCERYPQITLDIGVGDRYIDLVRESVDCVVRLGELRDSSLVARRLAALRQVTCASRAYVERFGVPATLADLDAHRAVDYVSASTGRSSPLEFITGGRTETRTIPSIIAVNNGDAYLAACEAGLGMVQIPRYRAGRQIADGTLIEFLPDSPPPNLPLSVLYPHHRHLSPRVRVFVDWLAELLGPLH